MEEAASQLNIAAIFYRMIVVGLTIRPYPTKHTYPQSLFRANGDRKKNLRN